MYSRPVALRCPARPMNCWRTSGSRRAISASRNVTAMRIVVDDLSGPEIAALLEEHVREARAVTPLESKFALDLDGLRQPEITFWTVWDGEALVGCGALKRLDVDHAEIKSMRTASAYKRGGVGSRLLEHIIGEARRMGLRRLSLETGSAEFFAPA